LGKTSLLGENFTPWGKLHSLGKTSLFVDNFTSWGKLHSLGKTSLLGENFTPGANFTNFAPGVKLKTGPLSIPIKRVLFVVYNGC
jgi:hypothetical protein